MTQQTINTGTSANSKNGDPLRTAFTKANANFAELYTLTGGEAVAIGKGAGANAQGPNSVAIGSLAGNTNQAANSIIINATGAQLNGVAAQTDSFYVAPIRSATATSNILYYNTTTKEVSYGTAPTAYVATTTGYNVIDSTNPLTISRNGMTIGVTSAGMIRMSFNSVIYITGRSSINNADSAVISSPNGATTSGTWYNIGAVLAVGDHLTATIVDSSFHRIYRLTAIIRQKDTTPSSEFATAYAIIEQLQ